MRGSKQRKTRPQTVVLTGGASRMAFFPRAMPRNVPGSKADLLSEPEFSIARGLAYAGRTDELLKAFREEIHLYLSGNAVEEAARAQLPALLHALSELFTSLIAQQCAAPAADAWRDGSLRTLQQMREQIARDSRQLLLQPQTQQQMRATAAQWLETCRICCKRRWTPSASATKSPAR